MTTTDQDRARIAARYPARPGRHRAYQLLALLLGLLLVGWMVWAGMRGSTPPVSADVHGFTITSDHSATATLRVQRRDPRQPVTCRVLATAQDFVQVGERDVAIPGGSAQITSVPVELRTLNRATTVQVKGCRPA